MRAFFFIWLGQLFSKLGSGLTHFALGVWVYQTTGSSTLFALILFFVMFPGLLISPMAGVVVDRWSRRTVMILSSLVSLVSTLLVALMVLKGAMNVWVLYVLLAVGSVFEAFQLPALAASITLLVPKQHYGRANGLVQACQAVEIIFAPLIAGFLVGLIGIGNIILINVATFLFAALLLLLVTIPSPTKEAGAPSKPKTVRGDLGEAWSYLVERKGLLVSMIFLAFSNFFVGIFQVLLTPLVLSFSTSAGLGTVMSIAGVGMLAGVIVLGAWGGPRRRMDGMLGFSLLVGAGMLASGLGASTMLVAAATFVVLFSAPFINGCNQAIWQAKVPPEMQGRVFSLRRTFVTFTSPVAFLIAGPLADYVFEPLLAPDGLLAGSVGGLIGVGKGRGIGFLFMLLGGLNFLVTWAAMASRTVRNVEEELPDVIAARPAGGQAGAAAS